jgi:NAD(P)-dependent dehydrogenase (short-subunit alcohol dehydrogenase family)
MQRDLEGRIAIVTGAGSSGPGWGTGKAIAVTFARAGARVVLVDVNPEACKETMDLVLGEGGHAFPIKADVADAEQVKGIVEQCIDHYGALDIVVNNVGIALGQGLLQETEEKFDRTLAVNTRSVFLMCKYAMPHLLKSAAARILNVASIAAMRVTPMPPSYGYCASKAALVQLTRAMALEFASQGVRCNTIVPGMLDTPIVYSALRKFGRTEEQIKQVVASRDRASPTGKQGTAFDIAEAALFLASDRAGFINGTELVIDGGHIQAVAS